MSHFLSEAIQNISPRAHWYLNGTNIADIVFIKCDGPAPTIDQISLEVSRIQQLAQAERPLLQAKAARAGEIEAVVVSTASGKSFDGNEEAQGRMSRAITALDPGEATLWVLADNTPAYVTREELREALRLAGEAQTAIWVRPYQ